MVAHTHTHTHTHSNTNKHALMHEHISWGRIRVKIGNAFDARGFHDPRFSFLELFFGVFGR